MRDTTPLRLSLQRIALTQQPEAPRLTRRSPACCRLMPRCSAAAGAESGSMSAWRPAAPWSPDRRHRQWRHRLGVGDAAPSRSLSGAWTGVTLVNTTDAPTPATLTVASVPEPFSLAQGEVFAAFWGQRIVNPAGDRQARPTPRAGRRSVGHGAAAGWAGAAGHHDPLGRLSFGRGYSRRRTSGTVDRGTGVLPWPDTPPQDVNLPQCLTLQGKAQSFRLSPAAPVLLRLSSSAPVILALGKSAPVLFGNGVTQALYLPTEETVLRVLSPQDGPLSGTLELSGTPVIPIAEGLGPPVPSRPAGPPCWLPRTAAGWVGLGVRADPDRVAVRLLDEHGRTLQRGVSMLQSLTPGFYLLEASVPPNAPTTLARPAVLGIVPHPNPPPPEVIRGLLLAAGFAPPDTAR